MAQFVCRMALPTGEIVERTMEASDAAILRRDLEERDYLVLELRERNPLFSAFVDAVKPKARLNAREFLFFNQEFSALVRAGLPILASLDILIERRKNPIFRKALADVRDRVKSGEALSDAFAAQGELFPKLYCSSLASGERSGEIPSVLQRYIRYSRNVQAIRKKVVSAMIYPSMIILLSMIVVAIMTFYVVPQFRGFLLELNVELPLITVILVDASTFLTEHWVVVVGSIAGLVGAIFVWARSGAGQLAIDRLKLRVPLAGSIIHDYAQNRFTRTLSTLVAGGIPLVSALELAARAVGNQFMEARLLEVTKSVREGQALWESLEKTKLVSDITIEMIKVGESTGSLVEMLDSASEFSEEEIDFRLNKVVTIIEPLMLVFIACVVTTVLLALYLPMIQAYGHSRF